MYSMDHLKLTEFPSGCLPFYVTCEEKLKPVDFLAFVPCAAGRFKLVFDALNCVLQIFCLFFSAFAERF